MMEPVIGPLSVGFEAGVGLPAGEYTFDITEEGIVPIGSAVHPWEGDEVSLTMTTVPVLAKAQAAFEVGPGEIRAGLGLGGLIISGLMETTMTSWDDPVAGTTNNADKGETGSTVNTVTTTWGSGSAAVFMAQITPGYHFKIGENSAIGLDLPITIASKATLQGGEDETTATSATTANPIYTTRTYELGGVTWGVNIVYTHRM